MHCIVCCPLLEGTGVPFKMIVSAIHYITVRTLPYITVMSIEMYVYCMIRQCRCESAINSVCI